MSAAAAAQLANILQAWHAWANARGLPLLTMEEVVAGKDYGDLWYAFRDGYMEGHAKATDKSTT